MINYSDPATPAAQDAAAAGERRLVAVRFADMAGLTAIAERICPSTASLLSAAGAVRRKPVGTSAARSMQAPEPDAKPLTATTTSQAVTPMDEQHTIYYYSGWEDNAIIEAQQRVITRTPQPHMLGIRADHALNGSAG